MENVRYETIRKHPNYIISTDGKVWDKTNNRECVYTINPLGIKSAIIDGEILSLDLLLLITFKPNDKGYIIKHKDGNRDNINLDNLYWYLPPFTEYDEDECKIDMREPVYVINDEGEIIDECESYVECANVYGISQSNVGYSIRNRSYNKAVGGYICRKEDFTEEYIEELKEYVKQNYIYVLGINGDTRLFRSPKEIVKELGVSNGTISSAICFISFTKSINSYIVRYDDIDKAREKMEKKKLSLERSRKKNEKKLK